MATELDARETSLGRGSPERQPMPSQLGRYRIKRELGAGAMGTVLLAEDPELERELAIKILRRHVDEHLRQLLVTEAQAMARLAHPNVVAVFDVGREGEQVFVAMEYVPGQTLREWQAEHKKDWRAVVAAYLDAARGLEAAHLAGVVHRDFKPDNVLMSDAGVTKVTDFGLAHFAAQAPRPDLGDRLSTLVTSHAIAGTPAYIAPEIIAGQAAGPRADQFSFCVALWEAVYGERPFRASKLTELFETITGGQRSPPPREVKVPTALRKLLERGLQVDSQQRFASMSELCAELEEIQRPWFRRYAGPMIAAALVLSVGGGAAISREVERSRCTSAADAIDEAWSPDRREAARAGLLATELSYVDDTWTRVDARLNDWTELWRSERIAVCDTPRDDPSAARATLCLNQQLDELHALVELFAQADATTAEHALNVIAELPIPARCDNTLARGASLPPTDASTRDELRASRAQLTHATVLAAAGRHEQAAALTQAELERGQRLEYPPLIADAQRRLGSLQYAGEQSEVAEATLIEAYILADRLALPSLAFAAANDLIVLFSTSSDRRSEGLLWSRLAADQVERLGEQAGLLEAKHLRSRARLEYSLSHSREALDDSTRARELADTLVRADDPRRIDYLSTEASMLHHQGDYDAAIAVRRRTLESAEQAFGPRHPKFARELKRLGMDLAELERFDEAKASFERALDINREVFGPESVQVSGSLLTLGNVAAMSGDTDSAVELMTQALELRQRIRGVDHSSVLHLRSNLAVLEARRGHTERALTLYAELLDATVKNLGPEHRSVGTVLQNMATAQHDLGQLEASRASSERALQIFEVSYGPEHPSLAAVLTNLANINMDLGELDAALAAAERALPIMETKLGSEHSDLAYPLLSRGGCLFRLERYAEAEADFSRALTLVATEGINGNSRPEILYDLARARFELGEREDAVALMRSAQAELEAEVETSPHHIELRELAEAWLAEHG